MRMISRKVGPPEPCLSLFGIPLASVGCPISGINHDPHEVPGLALDTPFARLPTCRYPKSPKNLDSLPDNRCLWGSLPSLLYEPSV